MTNFKIVDGTTQQGGADGQGGYNLYVGQKGNDPFGPIHLIGDLWRALTAIIHIQKHEAQVDFNPRNDGRMEGTSVSDVGRRR